MGFSYSTYHLLLGEAGTALHSQPCSLHSFQHLLLREAETGVAGPGPPLQLPAAAAEGRGWSLGSQSRDCAELPGDCQKCLGSFSGASLIGHCWLIGCFVQSCTIVFLFAGVLLSCNQFLIPCLVS